MRRQHLKTYGLFLVMLLASSSFPLVSGFYVYIIDNLGEELTVQCRSFEQDLGKKTLQYGGAYAWDFPITIGQTANYTCDISWSKGHGQYVMFYEPRDAVRCADQKCYWRVDPDGFYLYLKERDNYYFQFGW